MVNDYEERRDWEETQARIRDRDAATMADIEAEGNIEGRLDSSKFEEVKKILKRHQTTYQGADIIPTSPSMILALALEISQLFEQKPTKPLEQNDDLLTDEGINAFCIEHGYEEAPVADGTMSLCKALVAEALKHKGDSSKFEAAKQIVLEIRQYLCNTEGAPEPFTTPIDPKKLTVYFPKKILALIPDVEEAKKQERIEIRGLLCPRCQGIIDGFVKA